MGDTVTSGILYIDVWTELRVDPADDVAKSLHHFLARYGDVGGADLCTHTYIVYIDVVVFARYRVGLTK